MKKLVLLLIGLMAVMAVSAQDEEGYFIPIGAGYGDTYDGLLERIIAHSDDDAINILVIGSTFSYDSEVITEEERAENTADAENRRLDLEEVCNELKAESQTCNVTLAPLYIRDDALAPEALDYFTGDLDAVYFLGGDQVIAMEILAGTPVEDAIAEAHQNGAIIAGTSAGNAVQSRVMIGGYVGDFGPETGLIDGAVDVWNTDEQRGLSVGLDNVVLDQHFFQRTRLPRLLNVITQDGTPSIGVGVDAYTAVTVTGRDVVGDLFGLYVAAVLDAETFATAEYVGDVLSTRNVLVHLLAEGDSTYTISTRTHSAAPLPESLERDYSGFTIPEGAGTLMLGGDQSYFLEDNAVLARFVEISGGTILIVPAGFSDAELEDLYLDDYTAALEALGATVTTDSAAEYAGILLIGNDKTAVDVESLAFVTDAWMSGTPVLADNAPAAIVGTLYANHPPTPEATDDDPYAEEDAVQGAFLAGMTDFADGLGWVNLNIEPTVLIDQRLGRWFSLAYEMPDVRSVGITENTALEITTEGASIIGGNGVLVLDLSGATLDVGENDGFVVANGVMDTFAPGEMITP